MRHRILALPFLLIPALAAADSLPIVADTHTRYLKGAALIRQVAFLMLTQTYAL